MKQLAWIEGLERVLREHELVIIINMAYPQHIKADVLTSASDEGSVWSGSIFNSSTCAGGMTTW